MKSAGEWYECCPSAFDGGFSDREAAWIEAIQADARRSGVELLRRVLEKHHAWHLEGPKVYFAQDGKPYEIETDLAEAYVESDLCAETCAALKASAVPGDQL